MVYAPIILGETNNNGNDHNCASVSAMVNLDQWANQLKNALELGNPLRYERVDISEYYLTVDEVSFVHEMYEWIDPVMAVRYGRNSSSSSNSRSP